jgi:hypothetical protein
LALISNLEFSETYLCSFLRCNESVFAGNISHFLLDILEFDFQQNGYMRYEPDMQYNRKLF